MAFVTSSREVLRSREPSSGRILAPLAFLPYLTWELKGHGRADQLVITEHVVLEGNTAVPDWILDVPEIYANPCTRDVVRQMIRNGGYQVQHTNGTAALLRLPQRAR